MTSGFESPTLAREIGDAARSFLAATWSVDSVRDVVDAADFPRDLWQQAAELGWFDILTPESHGGAGLGIAEAAPLLEAAGYHLHVGPLLETMLARKLLAVGEVAPSPAAVVTLALEDVEQGPADSATRPTFRHGAVSGMKAGVPFADVADVIVVAAGDDDTRVLLAVDPTAAGVTVRPLPTADRVIRMADVELESAQPLGVIASGADAGAALQELHDTATALVSFRALGVSEHVLELSVAYAKERHQFGRPIGSFQAVQHRLAEMAVAVVASRSACHAAVAAFGPDGDDAAWRSRIAKAYVSRAARTVAEHALQVHGGIGFTDEHPLHLYYKHALSLASAWGTADEHEEYLALRAIAKSARSTDTDRRTEVA